MPRIKAASVPEHREAQRAAILEAARAVILAEGLGALTFGEIADRTGLARPSIYEYFRTKSALVAALVEEEAPKWKADVSAAMANAGSNEQTIAAFVRTILELVKAGRHELPFALAAGDLDADARAAMYEAHQGLFRLIVPTLTAMGVRDPRACVEMMGGVVASAGQALRQDKKRRGLVEQAVQFAIGGVRASVERPAPAAASVRGHASRRAPRGPSSPPR